MSEVVLLNIDKAKYLINKSLLMGIKDQKKEITVVVLLALVTFIFSLYTVKAYEVTQFARGATWNTGGPGRFLPWPKEPGHMMVITEMNPIDAFINQLIIESGLLAIISLIIWFVFLLSIYSLAKNFIEKGNQIKEE